MVEVSVSDLVTCHKYLETIPEYALKTGEKIHSKIIKYLVEKYWGEPEYKVSYTYWLSDEKAVTVNGRVDFIDHDNTRIIEIKPLHVPTHAEIQLLMYYELMVLNGYHYQPYLLLYRIRNGKLRITLNPLKPEYGIIKDNIQNIYNIAKDLENGRKPLIRINSCPRCPYRYECKPDYYWIRTNQKWILLSRQEYYTMIKAKYVWK
jgi:hypothetical protein